MSYTYTVREPLVCDYIASFDSDEELNFYQVIERADELTSQGSLDWEADWTGGRELNRNYCVHRGADVLVSKEEQALLDVGIEPPVVAKYIVDALGENLMDEIRGLLEAGVVPNLDELDEKGVDARELILNYVREAIVITIAD